LLGACLTLGLAWPAGAQSLLESGSAASLLGTTSCVGSSINIDANTLYVDCANNRVSVGDADAGALFDVEGVAQWGSGANKSTGAAAGGLTINQAAQVLIATGNVSVPGLGFNGDGNTGLFSSGADTIRIVTGGSAAQIINSSQQTDFQGAIAIPDGLSIRFAGIASLSESISNGGGSRLSFTVANAERLRITTGGQVGINDTTPDAQLEVVSSQSASGYAIQVSSQNDAAMLGLRGDGVLEIGTHPNISSFTVTGGLTMNQAAQALISTGNVSVPGLGFVGDTNTGIYSSGADSLNFATGGAQAGSFNSAQTLILLAPTRLFSRTALQIDTLTPVSAGDVIFCSNCATSGDVCVSTGTAAAQWRRIGTTAGCGSNG